MILGVLVQVLHGRTACQSNVQELTNLQAVVLETLRLRPPAYLVGRCASEDVVLGSYKLPAGTILGLATFSIQQLCIGIQNDIGTCVWLEIHALMTPHRRVVWGYISAMKFWQHALLKMSLTGAVALQANGTLTKQESLCRDNSACEPLGDAARCAAVDPAGGIPAGAVAAAAGGQAGHG